MKTRYDQFLLSLVLVAAGCTAPAAPIRETYLHSAAGMRLFVRIIGNGADTVVVLHGGPGLHAGYLVAPLTRLAAGRTLVVFDQRGRGRSDAVADSGHLTVQDDVDDLEALRVELKLSRFSVIAHHYGALVAADYALAHPDRISRLVLVGPMVPRALYRYDLAFQPADTVAIDRYRRALETDQPHKTPIAFCRQNWGFFLGSERETDPAVIAALAPGMCDPPTFEKARIDTVNARVTTALRAWDYRAQAGRFAVPVLVVTGNRNKVLLHAARTWAYRAPQGRILLLRSATQFPWVGAERRFTDAVDVFLSGRWPKGAARPEAAQVVSPDDSATIAVAVDSAAPGNGRGGAR